NAKTVTLNDSWDLTLVVGTADEGHRQKLFRVSTSVLKLVSPIWKAMFSGRFAKSITKSLVPFPDDSADAFLTVLRIAHFKSHEIPQTMSPESLIELAQLCDKYKLSPIVLPYAKEKNWLQPLQGNWQAAPQNAELQNWIYLTSIFNLDNDCENLINSLAMKVKVDKKDLRFYYMDDLKKVKLSEELPNQI
ncbi:hypothetical protein K505DRAFT_188399, partial [Melanomma pulvis-pyrius CBS 109.77]